MCKGNHLLAEPTYTYVYTRPHPHSPCIPCPALTQGCGRGSGASPAPGCWARATLTSAYPASRPRAHRPALPYWFTRSRAGRPLARTEQGAAQGGAPEQSVMGRRRAPTFPPVPPRGAPASGARRRPAVRAGGERSPGGRSRHRGRGPGWGQRRHTRRLPPRGKGSEAATLREAAYGGDGRLFPQRRSASLPPRRPPRVAPGSPGFLLLPHRCHPVRAAAEDSVRTRSGTQTQEAARRRTGAANRFSAASVPPAAFLAGLPHGGLSTRAALLQPTPVAPVPHRDAAPPVAAPARGPSYGRFPLLTCPRDPHAAPPPGTPSVPAARTPGMPGSLTVGAKSTRRCCRRSPGFPLFVRRSPLERQRPRARARGGGRGPRPLAGQSPTKVCGATANGRRAAARDRRPRGGVAGVSARRVPAGG